MGPQLIGANFQVEVPLSPGITPQGSWGWALSHLTYCHPYSHYLSVSPPTSTWHKASYTPRSSLSGNLANNQKYYHTCGVPLLTSSPCQVPNAQRIILDAFMGIDMDSVEALGRLDLPLQPMGGGLRALPLAVSSNCCIHPPC